jgi:hypothetical protein
MSDDSLDVECSRCGCFAPEDEMRQVPRGDNPDEDGHDHICFCCEDREDAAEGARMDDMILDAKESDEWGSLVRYGEG